MILAILFAMIAATATMLYSLFAVVLSLLCVLWTFESAKRYRDRLLQMAFENLWRNQNRFDIEMNRIYDELLESSTISKILSCITLGFAMLLMSMRASDFGGLHILASVLVPLQLLLVIVRSWQIEEPKCCN